MLELGVAVINAIAILAPLALKAMTGPVETHAQTLTDLNNAIGDLQQLVGAMHGILAGNDAEADAAAAAAQPEAPKTWAP